nr:hypothetical protein [Microbacterium bovistercoris]
MTALLTYREAASRVHRSIKTIKRWRRHGMPMGWALRDGQHVRVVEEEQLLGWYRGRLLADPVHRARMRAKARPRDTPDISIEQC